MLPINQFISTYAEGQASLALGKLFTHPSFSLDNLKDPEIPDSHSLLNYCHALAFGHLLDGLITGRHLINALSPALSDNPAFLAQLREDVTLLQISCLQGEILQKYLNEGQVQGAAGQLEWVRDCQRLEVLLKEKSAATHPLEKSHPSLYRFYRDSITYFSKPFYPFAYSHPELPHPDSQNPVIFMEPVQADWKTILSGRTAVLLFHHESILFQCMNIPSLAEEVLSRKHLIYLPQLYPNEQVAKQPVAKKVIEGEPLFLFERSELVSRIGAAIGPYCQSDRCIWRSDNASANQLYTLGKELHYQQRTQQLGPSRFLSLNACKHNLDWADMHKGPTEEAAVFKGLWDAQMAGILKQFPVNEQRRQTSPTPPLRIAHVMPQVVEGGHSPSKILKMLMTQHDRTRFQPHLLVTERLRLRPSEYPINAFASSPSTERGAPTLLSIQESGVPVFVDDGVLGVADTAQRIAKNLSQLQIDVAVFHGSDEINTIASRLSDVPLKVFFEHGTLPSHPGFDLVISSTEDAARDRRLEFQSIGSRIVSLPFVLDARQNWDVDAPSKAQLGVPSSARILTTISNHLEARLGDDMLWAVAQILQRHPESYYMPMGPVKHPEKLLKAFAEYGVQKQVLLLSTQPRPSNLARCMDIYLNEFPFGSCISMLEAMAAGCPPVTMYDPNGPTQARYGGDYFGIDHAVTSLRKEDYVELASKLLSDNEMYRDWSARAIRIYNERADTSSYTKKLEHRILEELEGALTT